MTSKYRFARGLMLAIHVLLGIAVVAVGIGGCGRNDGLAPLALIIIGIPIIIGCYQFSIAVVDIGDNTRATAQSLRSIGDQLERLLARPVQAPAPAAPMIDPLTADDLEDALRRIWRDRGDPERIGATWEAMRRQAAQGVIDPERCREVIRRIVAEGILHDKRRQPLEKMLGLI